MTLPEHKGLATNFFALPPPDSPISVPGSSPYSLFLPIPGLVFALVPGNQIQIPIDG